MNIIKTFDKAFSKMKEKNWDKIYVLVDVHDTLMKGLHQKNEQYLWYEWSLIALKMLSMRDDVSLILWTGSHDESIKKIKSILEKKGIKIDYVNENPEAEDNEFYCNANKIYFNVGIDDRFGFEPENDWKPIVEYLTFEQSLK